MYGALTGPISRLYLAYISPVSPLDLPPSRYGALTGLSKKKTRQQYGEKQFKMWRRSYDTKVRVRVRVRG